MIAQDLRIVERDKRIDKMDTIRVAAGKKNVLTAIVGRYKQRVSQAIQVTAKGRIQA
jgi:hypothetical protein